MWECEAIFLTWWLTQYKQIEKKNDVSQKTDTVLTKHPVLPMTSIQFLFSVFGSDRSKELKSIYIEVLNFIFLRVISKLVQVVTYGVCNTLSSYSFFIYFHFQTLRRCGGGPVLFRGRDAVREGGGAPRPPGGQPRGPPDLLRPRRQGQAGE